MGCGLWGRTESDTTEVQNRVLHPIRKGKDLSSDREKTAKDSSHKAYEDTIFCTVLSFPNRRMTLLLSTRWRMVIKAEASRMAAKPAPWAIIPTAMIWLAPERTKKDMKIVSPPVSPACMAMTAKEQPMGMNPSARGMLSRIPFKKEDFRTDTAVSNQSSDHTLP